MAALSFGDIHAAALPTPRAERRIAHAELLSD